ncbi:MAG: UvrD-helicase domain-containing protein, partial [Burkholderiaceae bacterium]
MTASGIQPIEPAFQCNGETVPMARFYAVACDPARHVAVEACAGAGKTWMLVSRIVRALLAGCAPHEILAISFTRRAAGEMRERLHQWLAEFARAEPAKLVDELIARGLTPAAAQASAEPLRGLYRTVLDAARPVQIRTFHGWFWTLLAGAPLSLLERLGLPADAELVEDETELVARLWPRFYQRLIEQPPLRADHLALVKAHGRFQTQKALDSVLQRRIEFGLADALGVVERSVDTAAQRFVEFADWPRPFDALFDDPAQRAQMGRAAKALGTGAPSFAARGGELEQALAARDMLGLTTALLTNDGEPRKFSDKITGLAHVREAQTQLLRARLAEDQQAAHDYQQRMTRLSRVLLAEFAALKRERGVLDMADVEHAAQHLLSDELLGGFLQERLDARVRHLLIDEFQDTNPLQWQALSAWLSGYVGSGGGLEPPRVFIVGDPKQSIYRFRRAEPQVFRAAQAFLRDGLGGDLLACDHTRRNAPVLLAALNDVMTRAQADGAYNGFRAHTTASADVGGVLELPPIAREEAVQATADASRWRDTLTEPRSLPEDTLQQRECRQAAVWIATCLADAEQGLAPRDVMVLARRRAPLGVLETELRALGVAATQPEQRRLADAPEVQDIVALLDAVVSPGHDLSTARMLRSPLFSVPDDALVQIALARHANPTSNWFELLLNPKQEMQELLVAQPDLPQKLRRWKGWLDTQSPHDALAAIYHDADVLARFAAAAPGPLRETVLANLRAVLSAALRIDAARYATPYALVRSLKSRYGPMAPASSTPDAVRLLTVHGAKGLEAPLVLLLDTEAQLGRKDSMGVLIDWPGAAAAPQRFVF